MLALLRERGETIALQPLAVDLERAWLITPDGGATLRSTSSADGRPGDQDPAGWAAVLREYAAVQRRTAGSMGDFLAAGVPDERPEAYPGILERLLADDRPWRRVDEADRAASDVTRRRLADLRPVVGVLADELAESGIPPSLDHGDLHGNNVLVAAGGDGFRLFDWGDSVVAHPFATLTTTLGSIGHHAGLDPYGPAVAPARDASVGVWDDVAPRARLEALAALAMDLGHLGKAAAWERALGGLAPAEMGGFHGATAAWLGDLVSRLEGR